MAKKFKGKYPGPDSLKGDKLKLAAYRKALKSGKSKSAALKSAQGSSAPAPKAPAAPKPPAEPTPAAPTNAYPSSNASANSNGTIQLQTNADIEGAVLEAEEDLKQAESEATEMEQQAEIRKAVESEASRQTANEQRGRQNASNAYRGLRGTSALRKTAEVESDITSRNNAINEANRQAKESARLHRERAGGRRRAVGTWADRARQEYTNQRSKDNPTAGSSPVDSGLRPTAPTSEGVKTNTVPKIGATPKKKSYKGKYPGPDRFKGNQKKIAAYKAAKRKAAK